MCGVSLLAVNQAGNSDPWGVKGWNGEGVGFYSGLELLLWPERVKTLSSLLSSWKMPLLPLLPLRFGGIIMLLPLPSSFAPPSHSAACVGIVMCRACACLHTS